MNGTRPSRPAGDHRRRRSCFVAAQCATLACLLGIASACSSGPDEPDPVQPRDDNVTDVVEVTPAAVTLELPDGSAQLQAVARNRAGSALSGRSFAWASSAPSVAAVSGSGVVTAVGPGTATITAAADGRSGTSTVTVIEAPVARVDVTPASATLVVGATVQLQAQPRDGAGNALEGRTIAWTSSAASIASVSATGLVNGASPGSAVISATAGGVAGQAAIQVLSEPVTGDLACGRLIAGTISAAAEVDVLTFTANAGASVLLTLTQTTAGFNSLVHARATLLSPAGGELMVFDSNTQRRIDLPATGTYTLRINASNLVTTGSYAIGLECVKPAGAVDFTLVPGGLIATGIDAPAEVDLLTLEGSIGDRLLLTVTQTAAGFNSLVHARTTLVSPSGSSFLTFDSNAQRTVILTEPGTWLLYVNASNLFTAGQYSIGLESLSPIGPLDGTLVAGSLIATGISAAAETDLYAFEGAAGQTILLTATQTTAGFNSLVHARVSVIGPTGAVVATFDSNAQRVITLPAAGTYLVQVNASNLFTAGSYSLGLESLAPLGPVDGTLAVGGLITATVSAAAEVDVYTFAGQAGENVLLTLAQTSGFNSLVHARATVLSPAGTQLVVFDSNAQRTVQLPETGTYRIYVNASNLFTTGEYTIGRQ